VEQRRVLSRHDASVSAGVLIGAPILFAIGVWTVTHPNGGYRAVGGAGSGVSPATRRAAGYIFMVMATLGVALVAIG
jgi:hypothetical protein